MGYSHFRHSRRALSNVVTGAIMLAAVAVMGAMVVNWSNSNLFANQQVLSSTLSTNVNKIKESLIIENVWFNNSPKVVNVTLTNIGTIGVNVTKISLGNQTTTFQTTTITNGGVLPGQTFSYNVTDYDWGQNTTVKVSITTARDNTISKEASP